jgi:hypothetical protein
MKKALVSENNSATALAVQNELERLGFEVTQAARVPLKRDELEMFEIVVTGFATSATIQACIRAKTKLISVVCYKSLMERESMSLERLAGSLQFIQVTGSLPGDLERVAALQLTWSAPKPESSTTEEAPNGEVGEETPITRPKEGVLEHIIEDDEVPF